MSPNVCIGSPVRVHKRVITGPCESVGVRVCHVCEYVHVYISLPVKLCVEICSCGSRHVTVPS